MLHNLLLNYRRKFLFTPLLVKVAPNFPRKTLMHLQHRNFLMTSHNIMVGRGIGGITHNFVLIVNREQTQHNNPPLPNGSFADYSNTRGYRLVMAQQHYELLIKKTR